ncbi:hypothetical protein [Lentibacillus saliphilus]|uniref:hypothetical protein n=1 Tax=Lentibacillus saliphilus TaxID=2737028 RepID=UPI001C30B24E|nr:hypothetical protein [Lentibacillus saliphilus]
MNRWFMINGIAILVSVWALFTVNDLGLRHAVGGLGVALILFNWTRHAVFTTIRENKSREVKIRFAQLSKKVLPFHRWIGTSAVVVVWLHAWLVIDRYGFYWAHPKFLVGFITGSLLLGVATFGWLRLYWPSGKKRMLHLYLAMTMFCLMIVHLIL